MPRQGLPVNYRTPAFLSERRIALPEDIYLMIDAAPPEPGFCLCTLTTNTQLLPELIVIGMHFFL
jgi:hypothetical protein